MLKSAKPPTSNISAKERQAIGELKKEESIIILPANKGRATVILDKEEYDEKVNNMLSDKKTYRVIKRDPTDKFKARLVKILTRLKATKKITKPQYKYLYPTADATPRLYCTPKIHKEGTPLRPIANLYNPQSARRSPIPAHGYDRTPRQELQGVC